MSGFGERFRKAGYTVPKSMIEIEDKPLISHVIDMFPGEEDFTFVCAQPHLEDRAYRMEETLRRACPTARIAGIPAHKLGPVHAVRQVEHLLDPQQPVVVNYCDFTCYWDWRHFKEFVWATACDGAIPAYRGFHPHSLGSTNYAYVRETGGWVRDIQEKQPYTNDRMSEFASSGTYYFATAQIMSNALRAAMEQDLSTAGEFYVSLAYKPMLTEGRAIAVYPLQHFMQWGTPEDVDEYNYWSNSFRRLGARADREFSAEGSIVIPVAGLGRRFSDEGYERPKPLITISGKPMVAQASYDLPPAANYVFVLRTDMPGYEEVSRELNRLYPRSIIETVGHVTQGQACSALIGVDALEERQGESITPITIGACDNGALYDLATYRALISDPAVDVIVWGVRGHPNAIRHPSMYGWIDAQGDAVRFISVKETLRDPKLDPVVLGTFTFRRADDFRRAVHRLIARDGRVNGEFYIDSCINDAIEMGLNCRLFGVESYLCWGTPDDLRTFEYWQSCFHKWSSHPYRLELDDRVAKDQIAELARRYQATVPELPGR